VGVTSKETEPTAPEVFFSAAAPVNVNPRLPEPELPTAVPLMAPVILVTVQAKVLGIKPEAKIRPGVPPLQTVAVALDVIAGLELTVTLMELGKPLQPDAFVSLT
jgi:hypothetical protein